MAQSSFNKCSVCDKVNGYLYCRDCEHFLCQTCKPVHDIFPSNKQHTVIDANKEGRRVFKPKPVCAHHKKEYVYFCNECDCLICSDCIISAHSFHPCCDYMNIVDQRRQNVIEKIETIRTKVQILEDSLNEIKTHTLPQINSAADDFDKQVKAAAKEIVCVIDSVKRIHQTTASDFQSTETEKLTNARENIEHVQNKYKDVLMKFEHVLQEQHGVTFLIEQKAIQMELDNIDEIPDIPTADKIPNFNSDSFTDQIIDELQKKFNIRQRREKSEKIRKLTEKLQEAQNKMGQKELQIATLTKENSAELAKLNDMLQQEKTHFAKLKKDKEREKTEEIRKLTEKLKEAETNVELKELKITTLFRENSAELTKLNDILQQEKTQFAKLKKDHEREKNKRQEMENQIFMLQKGRDAGKGTSKEDDEVTCHTVTKTGSSKLAMLTNRNYTVVTDIIQWSFIDEGKGQKDLVDYPPDVNLILESALKDQKTQASFYDKDDNKYIVDFNSYEEFPVNDPTDKVQVLRKSKLMGQTFELPSTWKIMDDKTKLEMVQLAPHDQEYQDVSNKFFSTVCCKVDFVKIERVQNKLLYQQFVAKKRSMDAMNPPCHQNERELWHGFSVDALDSICRYGFNRSYCGKNATAFGAGVYFAVNANYYIQDIYCRPDCNGHKRMFLCRVLTGEYCLGNSALRVPPTKPGASSHILYDTVTNDVNNPILFVIFHDAQAFPQYLVTFQRK